MTTIPAVLATMQSAWRAITPAERMSITPAEVFDRLYLRVADMEVEASEPSRYTTAKLAAMLRAKLKAVSGSGRPVELGYDAVVEIVRELEMTEEEAKTKWCPFAKVVMLPEGTAAVPMGRKVTRDQDNAVRTIGDHCIGSACMAWRWKDPTTPHLDDRDALGGYCGLAGKP